MSYDESRDESSLRRFNSRSTTPTIFSPSLHPSSDQAPLLAHHSLEPGNDNTEKCAECVQDRQKVCRNVRELINGNH